MEEIFFLFGGSRENKRAEHLVDCWKANGGTGTFYVTGYPKDSAGEVESIVAYLIERGVPRKCIRIAGSYETLSNVESCIDVLRNHDCIYASTSPLHWLRFRWIFFLYYPELRGKISFIPSGEEEQWLYAITLLVAYVIFTPKGWQKITQFLRKEEYELCKDPEVIAGIAQKFGVDLIWHERCKQVKLNIVWLAFLFRSLLNFLLKILVNKKVLKNLTNLENLYIIRYQKLFFIL